MTRTTRDFDHHSAEFGEHHVEIYDELRSNCPVARTSAHGGFWTVTRYGDVATVARDDETFSSAHDQGGGPRQGITIPPSPIHSGMIETDPPRFTAIRKAVNPFFAPTAVEAMRPEILDYATFAIDRVIERGRTDFAVDIAGPVPAMLTLRILGLPLGDWSQYAEAMHRGVYTPPDHADRPEVDEMLQQVIQQLYQTAEARTSAPKDDLLSFLAALEIDGQRMDIVEVVGNAFLLLAGGVDTTTALMLNAFLHLGRDRAARRWLTDDPSRLTVACEEYLRYVSPVQGLARTVTVPCELAGQKLEPGERLWISWGAANRDPEAFDAPNEIRLDRQPNRHTAFGLGAHRCLGSNAARAVWTIVVGEVLRRMPDYEIDEAGVRKYTSIGIVNGYASVPARFTPGRRIGTRLSFEA